jgi:hypothetical protein
MYIWVSVGDMAHHTLYQGITESDSPGPYPVALLEQRSCRQQDLVVVNQQLASVHTVSILLQHSTSNIYLLHPLHNILSVSRIFIAIPFPLEPLRDLLDKHLLLLIPL